MKLRVPFLSLLVLCGLSLPGQGAIREFRDTKGRPLLAEPVRAVGSEIFLRTSLGAEVSVPVQNFSPEDVTWLGHWIAAEPAALDYRFAVSASEKTTRKDARLAGGGEESARAYEVTVSNLCRNAVEGLRVCYRVFLSDSVALTTEGLAIIRNEADLLWKAGQTDLPVIGYNGTATFTTQSFALQKTFAGGGGRDRLRGVWLRFFRHGMQVGEWKSGDTPRNQLWPEDAAESALLTADREQQKPLLAALTPSVPSRAVNAPASGSRPQVAACAEPARRRLAATGDRPAAGPPPGSVRRG